MILIRRLTVCTVIIGSLTVLAFADGKVDNMSTVGFVEGDNQRDTISLLLSCFATLGLCVYSAVHLNIPQKREQSYRILLRELSWCIIGLFAPELILYTAWRQLAAARQLCLEVEQATNSVTEGHVPNDKVFSSSKASNPGTSNTGPWSIAQGFYGVMGGFVIDLDYDDSRYAYLFPDTKRLTLTSKGIALLAHCGHVPEISIDDIRDKNKADGLAKLLVCIQAGWMTVQVTTRAATGLSTSLLEVHTVAHVVCALIMYVIWWHKPRQVESPTILKGERLWPLAAYMFLASQMSGEVPKNKIGRLRNGIPKLKKLAYFEEGLQCTPHHQDTADTTVIGHFGPRPHILSEDHECEASAPGPESEVDSALQQLAVEAIQRYPALRSRFTKPTNGMSVGLIYSIPYEAELVQPHSIDWPNSGLLRRTQSLIMGMVLWGASMIYGAIHIAAWDYFFPSTLERLFWRLSAVWVTFCAAFWLVTNLLARLFPFIDRVWVTYNERRLGWLGTIVITALCAICGISYVVSRTFLVVEAFASIREVPKDVYTTPSWPQVFPHL